MGKWLLSRRDKLIVARQKCLVGRAERVCPKGLVPEGRCDRSLARSAWDGTIRNSRPVGYGMIRAGERMSEPIR
jgi:hypothetical protein